MFNVFTIVPTYCDRDGINGYRAFVHSYTFLTELGAKAVAVLMARDGDDMAEHVVVPVGGSPFDRTVAMRMYAGVSRPAPAAIDWDDDLPF